MSIKIGKSLKDLLSDDTNEISIGQKNTQCPNINLNNVLIKKKALSDLFLMNEANNNVISDKMQKDKKFEIYFYLLADEKEGNNNEQIIIDEIYLPKQKSAEDRLYIHIESIKELGQYISENNKKVIGWAHSHGKYDVYSSSEDNKNHKKLLSEVQNIISDSNGNRAKYIYSIITNAKEHIYASIIVQYPCGYIYQNDDVPLTIVDEEDYTDEEKKEKYIEYYNNIEKKVEYVYDQDQNNYDINNDDDNERSKLKNNILLKFNNTFLKLKSLLYQNLNEEEEENIKIIEQVLEKYDDLLLSSVSEVISDVSDKLIILLNDMNKKR